MTTFIVFLPEMNTNLNFEQLEVALRYLGINKIIRLSISSGSADEDVDGRQEPFLIMRDQPVEDCMPVLRKYSGKHALILLGRCTVGDQIAKDANTIRADVASDFVPWQFSIHVNDFRISMVGGATKVKRNFGILLSGEGCPSDYDRYIEEFRKLPSVDKLRKYLNSVGFGNVAFGVRSV
jgi:hypothetical protein